MSRSFLARIKDRILGRHTSHLIHYKLAQYADGSNPMCLDVSDSSHISVTNCAQHSTRGVTVMIVGPQPNQQVQAPVHVAANITGQTSQDAWLTNSSNQRINPDGPPQVSMNQYTWTWTNKTPPGSYLATVQASDGTNTVTQSVAFTVR